MAVASQGCRSVPYCRHHPEQTALYQIVQQHLETYLALAGEDDWDAQRVPAYVEREFRRYLECGILAYGFARARCPDCGHDYHCCVIDGVFEPAEEAGDDPQAVRFRPASALTPVAVVTIAEQVRVRVLRWLARSGLIERDDVREMLAWPIFPLQIGRKPPPLLGWRAILDFTRVATSTRPCGRRPSSWGVT